MADKLVPYIKDSDGSLLPVVALYDEEGNEITKHYQIKTGLSLDRDEAGYLILEEEEDE